MLILPFREGWKAWVDLMQEVFWLSRLHMSNREGLM